ncbi:DUF5659 domain-containing protein [Clostridium sp. DJ247]|uniref:DUF5659 domain-containing protein n=1 Tax=Clostridium sp. DJ247 TaxID=2726188 RepID=UPI001626F61A|nr:DUF5659 domain-containing protein [Clostridium sp. DJ247]MBC2579974.1 hypothetical protein [Clostridium sp. DJ247]
MEEKLIYSFNKACYIVATTNCNYDMKIDKETTNTYFVFPQNEEIHRAIREFSNENMCICNGHKFLETYKRLKRESIQLKDKFLNEFQ